MEDFIEIEINKKINSNERQPNRITISRERWGTYYDAIAEEQKNPGFNVPSINEFHVIGKYAVKGLPMDVPLISNESMSNNKIRGLTFKHKKNDDYESIEITLDKSKAACYVLVRIEYY